MEAEGTVYAYRLNRNGKGKDKFFVYEFEGADIDNDAWRQDVAIQVCNETVGQGIGDVIFMWKNKHA